LHSARPGRRRRMSRPPRQSPTGTTLASSNWTHLDQRAAAAVDEELMGASGGFSLDQLMELAGLSVAAAAADVAMGATGPRTQAARKTALVVCGPGNNGGDGLVAARHLVHFGMDVHVCYPTPRWADREPKPLFRGLVRQLADLGVPFVRAPGKAWQGPVAPEGCGASEGLPRSTYDVVVDAVFGFSFSGAARAPYTDLIEWMNAQVEAEEGGCKLVSVDVPSGWAVDEGPLHVDGTSTCVRRPSALVSLTAPKKCALALQPGTPHYLGGRFVTPSLVQTHGLVLPPYEGVSQITRLDR